MSTHRVEVVRLQNISKHPFADSLSFAKVFGYTVIFQTAAYAEGDLAVYIEPDYVVPDTPEFSFLSDKRIRARKLRGMWSQGLLTPAPAGANEGDDVMAAWGITRYEPPVREETEHGAGTEVPHDSLRWLPRYSLENLRRYPTLFAPQEPVYVTEKADGMQARFAFRDGRVYAGSHREWVKPHPNSLLSKALKQHPWIREFCEEHQDCILYGEILGGQSLKYGFDKGAPGFLAFDVLRGTEFVSAVDLEMMIPSERRVPGWFEDFDLDKIVEFSMSDSWIRPGQMAEGLVIRPVHERSEPSVGRVIAKQVSDRYLSKSS